MHASTKISLLCAAAFLWCCKGGASDGYDIEVYAPQYASGFVIAGAEGRQSTIIKTVNPWQGAEGVETQLFIARNGELPPPGFNGQILEGEPSKIVCTSSTHIAMLDAAGVVEKIVGVSGLDYVTNEYIRAHSSSTGDIGYDGNTNYELLASLDPDIVLLYGLNGASSMEGKLRELGIPFVYIGDYLEDSPTGKAEWMVAAGEIAGCRKRAEQLFAAIPQRYDELKSLAETVARRPSVMLNTPYGDTWFMASGTSYMARLIADAGGDYVYRKNNTTRSMPIDAEEASMLIAEAEIWLNIGDISSIGELKRRLPKFADAACIAAGEVWNFDLRTNAAGGNDFWESGIVHPDLILGDLIKIFHPELLPGHEFVYYRQLK